MNIMRTIRVEKVTLNIGAGKDTTKLENGFKLLETISKKKPVKTITKKRIPTWGLRPGLPIGCKVTLRKNDAQSVLKRVLTAKDFKLNNGCFDNNGNVSFGVHEYIDIPGMEYDPKIGMMGLEVCVTLERPGFRIKRRRKQQKKIPVAHKITKEESIKFMKEEYKVEVE